MKKVIVLFVLLFLGCMDVLATDVVTSVSLSENEEIWLENSTQIKYIIGYPASITPLNSS